MLRGAAGAVAVAAVALSVSGASTLGQAATSRERAVVAQERATAQVVADVWRSADVGSAVLASRGTAAPAALATDAVVAAEVLGERGGGASRSLDRTADAEATTQSADPVAQARAAVSRVVGQEGADRADDAVTARAGVASAAQTRAAVDAAAEQRAQEAAAAALAAAQADPRAVAEPLVAERGWDSSQFQCLDRLWTKESGWQWHADNPGSSAYGIPQSLPGAKMASHGDDWATNPATQIAWGLDYIADRYGTPCSAWSHSQAANWY